MTGFPASIPRTVGGAQRVERSQDHHARRGAQTGDGVVTTIAGDAGTSFTILRGPPPDAGEAAGGAIAVYADRASGQLAVPTGRVFVRFAEGIEARTKDSALARAGYRIAALIDYAPHAAWVEAESGDVAAALRGLERLAAIDGVVNVEPQLLSTRALK